MDYHDLEITVSPREGGGYRLRAKCEHGSDTDDFPSGLDDLAQGLAIIDAGVTDHALIVDVGERLARLLLRGENEAIAAHFNECRGATKSDDDRGIRIRLCIDPPTLASLPWEFIFSRREQQFVATSIHTPVVRWLDVPRAIRELTCASPVRMLVVAPDAQGIDTKAELELLRGALAAPGSSVTCEELTGPVTSGRLRSALAASPVQILHFIGHGAFRGDEAVLVLQGEAGEPATLAASELAAILQNESSVKLVVLNACEAGQVSSTRPMAGMAPELVRHGVPAVVAMQYPIEDSPAAHFAETFYRALLVGPDRGRIEAAISRARERLGSERPDRRDLGAPVVYLHAKDGVLFDARGAKDPLPLANAEADRARALVRAHERNLELGAGPESHAAIVRIRGQLRKRGRLIASLGAAAVLSFGLLWTSFFDALPQWLRAESYLAAVIDGRWPVAAPARVVAVVYPTVPGAADVAAGLWRRDIGQVIERVAASGARVIAVDIAFEHPTALDDSLIASIRRARASGAKVMLGLKKDAVPAIVAAADAGGHPCVSSHVGFATLLVPIVALPERGGPPLPALSLLAVEGALGASRHVLDPRERAVTLLSDEDRVVTSIGFFDVARQSESGESCTIRPGDTQANLVCVLAPDDSLRDPAHRLSAADVHGRSAESLRPLFEGAIVVVGAVQREDMFEISRGLGTVERNGFELHVEAIRTMLAGVAIHPPSPPAQYALVVLFVLLGGAIAYVPAANARATWLLPGIVAVYFACAALAYARGRVLLPTVYHLTALFLACGLARRARRYLRP